MSMSDQKRREISAKVWEDLNRVADELVKKAQALADDESKEKESQDYLAQAAKQRDMAVVVCNVVDPEPSKEMLDGLRRLEATGYRLPPPFKPKRLTAGLADQR